MNAEWEMGSGKCKVKMKCMAPISIVIGFANECDAQNLRITDTKLNVNDIESSSLFTVFYPFHLIHSLCPTTNPHFTILFGEFMDLDLGFQSSFKWKLPKIYFRG